MISFCDDCIHKKVCKYTDEVKRYEAKRPTYGTVTGPVVEFHVRCEYKQRIGDGK